MVWQPNSSGATSVGSDGPGLNRSEAVDIVWLLMDPAGAELDLKCFKFPILAVWTRTG
jgi:hypothetical protein